MEHSLGTQSNEIKIWLFLLILIFVKLWIKKSFHASKFASDLGTQSNEIKIWLFLLTECYFEEVDSITQYKFFTIMEKEVCQLKI